jgi:hypothetical protein
MSFSQWWVAHEELKRIAREKGCVRPRDLLEMNLSANWVHIFGSEFAKRARGVYFPHEVVPDRLVILLAKYPRMVVGLTTALWMHGILARRPKEDWLVQALNSREPVRYPQAVMVRTTWPHQHIEELKLQGVTFSVQQPARAVVDCIRFRQRLGPRRIRWVLEEVLASGKVTVEAIREIAAETRLRKPVDRALLNLLVWQRRKPAAGVAVNPTDPGASEPQG